MKYVVIFLAVVVVGMAFISLVDWLVSEPPPHVLRVKVQPPSKSK